MSISVSEEIRLLSPYVPGKPTSEVQREYGLTDVIKLASNENPLGTSPKVIEALKNKLSELNIYPDPSCHDLTLKLEQYWNYPSANMVIGNGSNELIDLAIRVFCEPGDKIIIPEKSFIAYEICAQAARVGVVKTPLLDIFETDFDFLYDYLKNKKTKKEKILFLANPNNPTGTYIKKEQLVKILDLTASYSDFFIFLDEAYTEFVRATDCPDGISMMSKYPHLVSCRTFSKVYGLAGLRVGALLGPTEILQWLHRVRNPFNVNSLAQVAVMAALDDKQYLENSKKIVWAGLDYFYSAFKKMSVDFIPSQGNFIMFDSREDGNDFFNRCLKKGLILRPLKPYGLKTHIRLTIGNTNENHKALEIIKSELKA